jgi:hypothetical protein
VETINIMEAINKGRMMESIEEDTTGAEEEVMLAITEEVINRDIDNLMRIRGSGSISTNQGLNTTISRSRLKLRYLSFLRTFSRNRKKKIWREN